MESGRTEAMRQEVASIMKRLSAQELNMLYSLARELEVRQKKNAKH